MQPFNTKHYEEFLKSREKAMTYLHKFYIQEQAAQYHLMMYMRQKKPLGVIAPQPKQPNFKMNVPYPEDMVFP